VRLKNFSILTGPRVTVTDPPNTSGDPWVISSSSVGSEVEGLDRSVSNRFFAFSTHFGDDTDENPYGNINVFNSASVSTSTDLALSQSISATTTGSVKASFLFLVEKNHRG